MRPLHLIFRPSVTHPCFRHPNIIRLYVSNIHTCGYKGSSLQDSAVLQDSDGEGKIVYLFLPIYKVRFSASHPIMPS